MTVTHANRRGDLYYLHVGKTRTGKPRYSFSRSPDGQLAPEIPAGYEIYENPGGQVFLRKDEIEVYVLDRDLATLGAVLGAGTKMDPAALARKYGNYTAMLRFALADPSVRLFAAERFCFRGGIDDWIFIGGAAPLPDLVAEFAPHLGQKSFYELG